MNIHSLKEGVLIMSVTAELNALVEKINADPTHIKAEKDRVFQVNLEESGPLQLVLTNGQIEVITGNVHNPDVTLIMNEKNFSKLLHDKLNTGIAFMSGSLKVEGKMGLALKLQEIVKAYQ